MSGRLPGGPTLHDDPSPGALAGLTPVHPSAPAPVRSPAAIYAALASSVGTVLYSQERTVHLAVGCLAASGHLLVEDLPGLGKTTLAKAVAHAFGLEFRRVQCTADLLPSDVTGAMVFDRQRSEPSFRKGPIFTNVLMADELNRASARTQSALLEAMEEHQVTVDGHSVPLPRPFLVVATQNPHDSAGTSPLPHGQRDRFLIRLSMGYPDRIAEDALLAGTDPAERASSLAPAIADGELATLTEAVDGVNVSPTARSYMLDIVAATRRHPSIAVGASPRAARALLRMTRATAVSRDRTYAVPDDVREVAVPVLAHRLLLDPRVELTGTAADQVVREVLDTVPVPLELPRD